jgi:hypothetical protein
MALVEKRECHKCGKSKSKFQYSVGQWVAFERLCKFCEDKNVYHKKGIPIPNTVLTKCLSCDRDFLAPNTQTRICKPCKGKKLRRNYLE